MECFVKLASKLPLEKDVSPKLKSQNKPSVAEILFVWYKIKSQRETLHKQAKNCLFMTKRKDFSPGDILFQLVYDRGGCAKSGYLKHNTLPCGQKTSLLVGLKKPKRLRSFAVSPLTLTSIRSMYYFVTIVYNVTSGNGLKILATAIASISIYGSKQILRFQRDD